MVLFYQCSFQYGVQRRIQRHGLVEGGGGQPYPGGNNAVHLLLFGRKSIFPFRVVCSKLNSCTFRGDPGSTLTQIGLTKGLLFQGKLDVLSMFWETGWLKSSERRRVGQQRDTHRFAASSADSSRPVCRRRKTSSCLQRNRLLSNASLCEVPLGRSTKW